MLYHCSQTVMYVFACMQSCNWSDSSFSATKLIIITFNTSSPLSWINCPCMHFQTPKSHYTYRGLVPIPACIAWKARDTLDKSKVCHSANTHIGEHIRSPAYARTAYQCTTANPRKPKPELRSLCGQDLIKLREWDVDDQVVIWCHPDCASSGVFWHWCNGLFLDG